MSKVKVVTTVAAWPEALFITRKQLDRFLDEDYELIACIDTPIEASAFNLWDPTLRSKAISISNEICDQTIEVPFLLHENRKLQFPHTKEKKAKNANTRAADSLQFAWNQIISDSKTPVLLLDSDMFPIQHFSISENIRESPVRAIQVRSFSRNQKKSVPWIWSGLLYLDPPKMENKKIWSFDCGKVNGIRVDVSGQTANWIERNPAYSIRWMQHYSSLSWNIEDLRIPISKELRNFLINDDRNQKNHPYCEIYDNTFLHFRAGSNWRLEKPEIVKERNLQFFNAISK